jgi:phosphoribosylformimino-5-aminoimidazole carboxamide ribotide isomerase
MRIIPAIDIIEGKCVRLTRGDYRRKKVYNENPLEVAKTFEDIGLAYLHLVDLDGAKARHIVNWRVLEKLASHINLKIDFSGGINNKNNIRIAFESGAHQVTVGSIAVRDRETFLDWLKYYGSEKVILGADTKDNKIVICGWQKKTGLEVTRYIYRYQHDGVQYVICTDIAKDGMLEGPSFALYKKILEKAPGINLIASGGVNDITDIKKLSKMKLDGVIIGKAIYEGKITLNELKKLC